MGWKKSFNIRVLSVGFAVLSAFDASAVAPRIYDGDKPCYIIQDGVDSFLGIHAKANGTCKKATWMFTKKSGSNDVFKMSIYTEANLDALTLDKAPASCNCAHPNSYSSGKKSKPKASDPAATASSPTNAATPSSNSDAPAQNLTANAATAQTSVPPAATPGTTVVNNNYYGAGAPQQSEGEPIAEYNSDKTVRTFYTDKNHNNAIDNDERGTFLRRETGTQGPNGFEVKTVETPPASDDASKNMRYSYTNSAGNTVQTNSIADVNAAAKASGKNLTVVDNGKVKVIDPNGKLISVSDADGKTTYAKGADGGNKQANTDPCSVSTSINGKYSCQGTSNWVKGTDIGNKVLEAGGSTIVNTIGQMAAAKAQNGSMSSGYVGAAKMANTSLNYQKAITAMNLVATSQLAKKTKAHKNNIAEMQGQSFNLDGSNQVAGDMDQAHYEAAIKEQTDYQNRASTATMAATMASVKGLSNALASKAARDGAQKAALTAKQIEAAQNQQGVVWDSSNAIMAGTGDPNQMGSNSGTDSSNSQNGTNDPGTSGDAPTNLLGNGNDTGGGDNSGPLAPPAGAFKAAAGSPSGSGAPSGGGSAGGGGGGGAGAGSGEESKAGYASEFGTKERYESGGVAGGKGGAGKTGGKDDGAGVDLNGLLAQFLPKTEQDLGPKNGILDYAGAGARAPAAVDETASYLDKNADLFQRIHETMSEKNRKGHVGI